MEVLCQKYLILKNKDKQGKMEFEPDPGEEEILHLFLLEKCWKDLEMSEIYCIFMVQ